MPKHDKNQYSLQEVYRWYKNNVTEPLDYATHKLVLETWGSQMNGFLLLGKDVKLHQGLSVLAVRKKEQRTFVDRQASKKAGKRILIPNVHSGFFRAYVYWRRKYTKVNSTGWAFKPSRTLSRALSQVMQKFMGHTRFVQRAKVTRKENQRKAMYNKKVHKL